MHVTKHDLRRLRQRQLTSEEVLAIGRHLGECADCAALARAEGNPIRAAQTFRDAIGDVEAIEHPDPESELAAYADGQLRGDDAVAIEEHLQWCATCREDVEDLRPPPQRRGHGSRLRYVSAAAAAGIVIVSGGLLLLTRDDKQEPTRVVVATASSGSAADPAADRQRVAGVPTETVVPDQPQPPVPTYADSKWAALIDKARQSRRVTITADLRELRPPAEVYRGAEEGVRRDKLIPRGEVVESPRPRMTWPATRGGRYIVSIYAGGDEVARSGTLQTATWMPSRDLPRGKTLTWQVEVTEHDGAVAILPIPPDPPAMFRVATTAVAREIENARQAHPGDHLLRGLLLAQHGILGGAEAELAEHASAHPDDAVAASLLDDVRKARVR